MSDVFQRQRGLVDQAKLSKLAIRFANKAAFPQQFIESFELIGQQLGINQFCHNQQKVSKDIDEYTLNWSISDNKATTSSALSSGPYRVEEKEGNSCRAAAFR